MQNHVTSKILISGPELVISNFIKKVIEHGDEPTFDFNKIIPMPDAVRNTSADNISDMGLELLQREATPDRYGFSPNGLIVSWYPQVMTNGIIDWDLATKLVLEKQPNALIQGQQYLDALNQTGSKNWYDWSCANWGTKWNSYDYSEISRTSTSLEFTMDTAWSFPEQVFDALSEQYPELEITTSSFDDGWNFACTGYWVAGTGITKDVKPSKEFYEEVYGRECEDYEEEEEEESQETNLQAQ